MSTVTEAQKKQIMIILSIFLAVVIYISGIRPMMSTIEVNKNKLAEVEAQRTDMQQMVENPIIENNYSALREEYQTKFQERFENFRNNEIIESITTEFNHPIKSIKINDFKPVDAAVYQNYVAQPKTAEELSAVLADMNSPIFPWLLCSEVNLTLEIGLDDELEMYDAFNNIVPVGPGEADQDRYCLLVPIMNLRNLEDGTAAQATGGAEVSYKILVFAMETMDLTKWDEEFAARKQGS